MTVLHDGEQSAEPIVDRLVAFVAGATRSLDIALYDAHFRETSFADRIVGAINDAEKRGVDVRAVYNDDDGPGPYPAAVEPKSGPSFLYRLHRAVPSKGIDGRYDLMHHKYMIRDRSSVWTGSSNWTDDSWTRMENLLFELHNRDLAAAYTQDFEYLWRREQIEGAGAFDDKPATMQYNGQAARVRALFSPGRGEKMSQLIATRIGQATQRIRICSPVITSTPILGTLAEVVEDNRVDVRATWDGPQMREVVRQWRRDGRTHWKQPLVDRLQRSGRVAAKRSTPFGHDTVHDFMHAKLVVCDDWVLTGSFNCSHSGERNAENLLEIRSMALADELAGYAEQVYDRYRGTRPERK